MGNQKQCMYNLLGCSCYCFQQVVDSSFSLLFLCSLQTETVKKHYRICDKCGKHSEYADSYNEALDKAKKAGWAHYVEDNKDYCPECKTKLDE